MSVKRWGEIGAAGGGGGGNGGNTGTASNGTNQTTNTTNTNTTTTTTSNSTNSTTSIVRSGYLKKFKTLRKKFFILRAETNECSARLEYYDSERKYNSGLPPKRSIPLKTCFNINRRSDTKYKHVIALYTRDDCFCIVFDNDDELDLWLKSLLSLQHGDDGGDGNETPKPTFEHVWQVTVLKRGLGTGGLTGSYRLCLTDKTLSLIKRDCETNRIELNLSNIRSCGNLRDFFFLEIGRSSTLGAGELWMESEDHNIAQNIHSTVFHAMTTNSTNNTKDDNFGPKCRNRSSSATESSKPLNARKSMQLQQQMQQQQQQSTSQQQQQFMTQQQQQHLGLSKSHLLSQGLPIACRERCDSMPSRPRTTSEGNHPLIWNGGGGGGHLPQQRIHLAPYRPVSLHARDISHSPPSGGSPVSPPSVGCCSTDSAGSSYSLTDEPDAICCNHGGLIAVTPDEAIVEEDSILCGTGGATNAIDMQRHYMLMAPNSDELLSSSSSSYVDMSLSCRTNNNNNNMMMIHQQHHLTGKNQIHQSPTTSLSSVTSGTPSTDLRFAEYPLEKVPSYFGPNDDDDDGEVGRPARAYSFGSHSDKYGYRNRTNGYGGGGGGAIYDPSLSVDNQRERAFSVGSKRGCVGNSGNGGNKSQSHRLFAHLHPYGSGTNNMDGSGQSGVGGGGGGKSSSAPILNSRLQSSYGSIGPMDDLMEIDFTRGGDVTSDYMEMKPGGNSRGGGGGGGGNATPDGYVEMKPGIQTAQRTEGYVEMRVGGATPPPPSSTTTSQQSTPSMNNRHNDDYTFVDVRKHFRDGNDYMEMDRRKMSPGKFKSTDSVLPTTTDGSIIATTPEGYVEMTLGSKGHQQQHHSHPHHHHPHHHHHHPHHQRQSSLDSARIRIDGVTDERKRKTSIKKDGGRGLMVAPSPTQQPPPTTRSQPITIVNNNNLNNKSIDGSTNDLTTSYYYHHPPPSTSTTHLLNQRKYSTGTPPKMMQLALGGATSNSPYASLPRQRTRHDSATTTTNLSITSGLRRDSKDSSSSSVTTPSSAIFSLSLNSPCSPTRTIASSSTPKDDDYIIMEYRQQQTQKNDDYVNLNDADGAIFRPIDETFTNSAANDLDDNNTTTNMDEIQLHYASLDLDDGGNRSPRNVLQDMTISTGTTPTPTADVVGVIQNGGAVVTDSCNLTNSNNSDLITSTYAAIDFLRSEDLKQTTSSAASAVAVATVATVATAVANPTTTTTTNTMTAAAAAATNRKH